MEMSSEFINTYIEEIINHACEQMKTQMLLRTQLVEAGKGMTAIMVEKVKLEDEIVDLKEQVKTLQAYNLHLEEESEKPKKTK